MRNCLRVMSWNIGQMYTKHFKIFKFLPFLNKGVVPTRYLPTIARTIQGVAPHVVCLQEVRPAKYNPDKICQLEKIENSLGGVYKGFYGTATDHDEYPALLVKTKYASDPDFKIENISLGKQGVGVAAYMPKNDTWVVNVHLEHYDYGLRQRQIDKLLQWVHEQKQNVIIGGDYNMRKSWYFTERYRKQVGEFFAKLQKKYNFRDATKNIDHTHFFQSKLDYFMANFPKKKKETAFVLTDMRWWFMDHYPIVGDFFIAQKRMIKKVVRKAKIKRHHWAVPKTA